MCFTRNAQLAMRALNGIICVYKPTAMSINRTRSTIFSNLCRDLNQMDVRPVQQMVDIVGPITEPMKVELVPDLSDHPLVVGPRYQPEDFRAYAPTLLDYNSSGVLLVGLNSGCKTSVEIHKSKMVRAYKIKGRFGSATDTFFANGKVVERAGFKHVTREKIDKIVAYMQTAHQKKMHELSGIDMGTQAGYELASSGLIRPADNKIPVIYGMKCVHFEPPYFTIEIQAINEYEKYMHTLIHDIGMQLKTVAFCTAVQCIRHGRFTLDHAILKKHWDLPNILYSIENSHKLLADHPEMLEPKAALAM